MDGLLFDLGVSSPQLDEAGRGFSFMHDGPLDMRMDPDSGIPASEWLASVDEKTLKKILWKFGEETHAGRIARAIVEARAEAPVSRTAQLARIVEEAKPARGEKKHPATKTFQAIRIAINKELEQLESLLSQSVNVLRRGGRLCVISFHSLEDRIVKRFMRREARGATHPPDLPLREDQLDVRLRVMGKPLRPAAGELQRNPRARSAVLRVAERL